MRYLFHKILEQVDDTIKLKLKSRVNWNDIAFNCNVIELLRSLREVCYGIDPPNPNPLDSMRRQRQFLACMQKEGQSVDDYIAEVKSYHNVLKLVGEASDFRTMELINSTIKTNFSLRELRGLNFDALNITEKTRVVDTVDRIVIAFVIVEGSCNHSRENKLIRDHAREAGLVYNERTRDYEMFPKDR